MRKDREGIAVSVLPFNLFCYSLLFFVICIVSTRQYVFIALEAPYYFPT